MVHYFPAPYEDELLYSVIARYVVHTMSSGAAADKDLFGFFRKNPFHLILPNKLNHIVDRIRSTIKFDEEYFLKNHTLFPYVAAFASTTKKKRLRKFQLGFNRGSGILRLDGYRKNHFGYCPACVKIQREIYGEAFWTRSHNVPFVKKCIIHNCEIMYWVPSAAQINTERIFSAETVISNNYDVKECDLKARDFSGVLIEILHGHKKIDLNEILKLIFKKGLEKVILKQWSPSAAFPKELNEYIISNYPSYGYLTKYGRKRIRVLIRGKRYGAHPILFLIILEFIKKLDRKAPKCINLFCPGYAKEIARDNYLGKKFHHLKVYGFFVICPICWMRFTYYFDKRKPRIIDYGELFKSEINNLLFKGATLEEISEKIGVWPVTVRNILKSTYKPKLSHQRDYKPYKDRTRKKIELIVKQPSKRIINLIDRDQAVLKELQEIYSSLDKSRLERRISRSFLVNQCRQLKGTSINVLPESKSFLSSVEEDRITFLKRRISNYVNGCNDLTVCSKDNLLIRFNCLQPPNAKYKVELEEFISNLLFQKEYLT
jgi:hypothetical protein